MMAGITKRKLTWRNVRSYFIDAIILTLLTDNDVQEKRVQADA